MADTVMKAREAERKAVALGKPIARPATDLFHAPTHGTMCSQEYSIGNLDGAGWTVGAEAEQAFAHTKDGTHVVARSMSNPGGIPSLIGVNLGGIDDMCTVE